MNTSRRGFFTKLAAAAVGVAVDPELLAWEPGKRTFFDLHQQYAAGRCTGFDWYLDQTIVPEQVDISLRMIRNYDLAKDLYPARFDVINYGAGKIEQEIGEQEIGEKVLDLIPSIYAGRSGQAISKLGAASEGFVLTETMPRAEFERRWREV